MVHRIAPEINFLLWFGLAIVIVTNKDTIYVNPSFHADKPKKEKDRTNVIPLFHCCIVAPIDFFHIYSKWKYFLMKEI